MKKFITYLIFAILFLIPCSIVSAQTVSTLVPVIVPSTITGGQIMLGLIASRWTDNIVLTSNSAYTYTIPAGGNALLFSSSVGNLYINFNGVTATVPASNILTGSGHSLNRMLVQLQPGTTSISMISDSNCVVSIDVYNMMVSTTSH